MSSKLTDENLLKILLMRNIVQDAPTKVTFYTRHHTITIGIGKDHTATIVLDDDALTKLEKYI